MTETHHQQVAALCWRWKGSLPEVLLVTSRETKRWIIPKGWPMADRKDHAAAKREALEEAGVDGEIGREPIGQYSYEKIGAEVSTAILVTIYPLQVTKLLSAWPEKGERKREWFVAADAAQRVAEPGLKAILRNFRG